jgi:hypothetical protein
MSDEVSLVFPGWSSERCRDYSAVLAYQNDTWHLGHHVTTWVLTCEQISGPEHILRTRSSCAAALKIHHKVNVTEGPAPRAFASALPLLNGVV